MKSGRRVLVPRRSDLDRRKRFAGRRLNRRNKGSRRDHNRRNNENSAPSVRRDDNRSVVFGGRRNADRRSFADRRVNDIGDRFRKSLDRIGVLADRREHVFDRRQNERW
jgi:hypothetical protein